MKRSLSDLALFGGTQEFDRPLHVGRPHLPDRRAFEEHVGRAFDACWLTNDGPLVRELEEGLSDYLGVRHCVAVANGTLALQLLLKAHSVSQRVVAPSFTFVATAHAAAWLGIEPVFGDIELSTHNLDPEAVGALLDSTVEAIIGVHVWGRPCRVEALQALADEANVPLFFDAAHALGCTHKGRRVGGFGAAEVLSFHATKSFSTLEGGAVTTNDDSLADELRLLRNFGFIGYDSVARVGTNAKLNEISAAFGLASLDGFEEVRRQGRELWQAYRNTLAEIPGLDIIEYEPAEDHNFHYNVVTVNAEDFGLNRDSLLEVLHAENVLARRYFHPGVHRMEPYRHLCHAELPATDELTASVLVLPSGGEMTGVEAGRIGSVLECCHRHRGQLGDRFEARGR